MFSSICLVSVAKFNNGKLDKNGKPSMLLNVIAGESPNRNVISGTIAEQAGFEEGKIYLAQVREGEPSAEFGRQFTWVKLGEASVLEAMKAQKELGKATIFEVVGTTAQENATAEKTEASEKLIIS